MPAIYTDASLKLSSDKQNTFENLMFTDNLGGIEGIPYQFLDTVDRRLATVTNDATANASSVATSESNSKIGRKYAEKIMTQMPILFLTPCEPVFAPGFGEDDKNHLLTTLISGGDTGEMEKMLENNGRLYGARLASDEYSGYLNTMMASVAAYLNIADKTIPWQGEERKICSIDWIKESEVFRNFFAAETNIAFYLDGLEQVSETFQNSVGPSSIASSVQGQITEIAREVQFLLGGSNEGFSIINGAESLTSFLADNIGDAASLVAGGLGAGVLASIGEGADTLLNGGKIIFPDLWTDSDYSKSYSLDIKLRSPDNDTLSIFLNVIKPYCKLLSMCMPRITSSDGRTYPNGYKSPFLVKAYCKGVFSINLGMITGLSATKGAACCWNDDGLPTQIDISLDIADLYHQLAMSTMDVVTEKTGFLGVLSRAEIFNNMEAINAVTRNTEYMDFLANMSGLNIANMGIGRAGKIWDVLLKAKFGTMGSRIFSKVSQKVQNTIGGIYNWLN